MLKLITGLLSGIGTFIFALYLVNVSLSERSSSLSPRLEKSVNKPVFGFFLGAALAILTQSSSAVNSVAVQLSDKDLLKEKTAYFVVMGTNIGTTVVAYIAVLSNLGITKILSALIFFGSIILMIAKNNKISFWFFYVCVLSLLFIGIGIISDLIPVLISEIDLSVFNKSNPLILLLISLLLTAVCQSSSLVSIITVTLTGAGVINIESAIFMIIGANVGTCSTALLVSIGKSKKGLNVALFNALFNFIGLIMHIFLYYTHLLDWFIGISVANDTKIALYHTFFNVSTMLFTLPFINEINNLLSKKLFIRRIKKSLT